MGKNERGVMDRWVSGSTRRKKSGVGVLRQRKGEGKWEGLMTYDIPQDIGIKEARGRGSWKGEWKTRI